MTNREIIKKIKKDGAKFYFGEIEFTTIALQKGVLGASIILKNGEKIIYTRTVNLECGKFYLNIYYYSGSLLFESKVRYENLTF